MKHKKNDEENKSTESSQIKMPVHTKGELRLPIVTSANTTGDVSDITDLPQKRSDDSSFAESNDSKTVKKNKEKKSQQSIKEKKIKKLSETNTNVLKDTKETLHSISQQTEIQSIISSEISQNTSNSIDRAIFTITDKTQVNDSRQTEISPATDYSIFQQSEQASQPSLLQAEHLADGSEPIQPLTTSTPASTQKCYLVTNHLNMAHIMAAGMVMGPAGFGGKHYSDVLTTFPGQIPLFFNQIPEQALTEATKEGKYLCPCIATVSLDALHGEVLVLSQSGMWRKLLIPGQIQLDDIALLVRAPLPVEMISNIIFKSQGDQKALEERAHSSSNFDASLLPTTIQDTLFMDTRKVPWPPTTQPPVIVSDVPPARGQAVGSILAMLYHSANYSDLGVLAYKHACGVKDAGRMTETQVLSELVNWFENGRISDSADIPARLFWGVVDALISVNMQIQIQKNSFDVVISHIEQVMLSIQEGQKSRNTLEKLRHDLRSISGFGSGTVSEILGRHNGPVSIALLLFFLRDKADDLFEFYRNQLVKEDEIICAAILFGARASWLNLPLWLRTPKELATYVIQRMAAVEQGVGGMSFGPFPPRPQPLRELFQSKTRQWNKEQEAIALDISRSQKWSECLKTEISLQPGQYQLEVDINGVHILMQGDTPATTTRVIPEKILRRIGSWPPLDEKVESKIRAKLKVK